ncbi:MAG: BirA, biotin-(Acetyl-CoA-carboxylase) ligase [uncultured Campylobacterales bacterium]|uniref:BirA, biotin-(Acetyl-CoA-carboxylase) ligase n=1 Tax=uncultured Campylobacterales bacterium TaxID=352960 RepID=A0A6S6S597_9BACT|nr:MAG: BirA, biotin-(Acetyl-CoA-carboxylase) ligase [uncultured Campylobacterales bacterium]
MKSRLDFFLEYFPSINSTHIYLLNKLKVSNDIRPTIVLAKKQTKSIGSRGNSWISLEGNLFFSLCFDMKYLPSDLKINSSSIYFSMIIKLTLAKLGSKASVKWPNDLYLNDKKIAGIICEFNKNSIIVSMGINTKYAPIGFESLDINISPKKLLELFVEDLIVFHSWKNIFNEFRIEFANNRDKSFHYKNKKYFFQDVVLCNDGSIMLENNKVYSIR